MSSNLQNSIWPNTDGNLGNIKIQIPDGVTTPWPTGDALVNYFVFNKGKLVGFVDIKALIANSSKTTTFPYDYVNISLPSIAEGEMTYNYDQCTYVVLNGKVLKGNVSSDEELEIITKKYLGCKTLADIIAVDPNYLTNDIINGVWKEGLADLEQGSDGSGMFSDCTNLESFNSNLSSLTDGNMMFYNCTNLESFNSNLSSLTEGYCMFYSTALESFTSDLSSLTDGSNMFGDCTSLTSFDSDLSKLTIGSGMFYGCKLNTASVKNIASTINTVSSGEIYIGIGNSTPNEEEQIQLSRIKDKGWTVYVNDFIPFSCIDYDILKYNTYTTCANLAAANPSYKNDITTNGEWNYYLDRLTNGTNMFQYSALASFNSDLSNLTNGEYMFSYCFELTSFKGDLSSLTDGSSMFTGCSSLTSFDYDLSSLTDGSNMFSNSGLTSFNADLSSLTNGNNMFYHCDNLALFDSDLPKLTNGEWMFRYCSALTTFNSNLSSLTSGNFMFDGCKLNTASVKNIASTINTVSSGTIHIGIGNSTPNTEEETSFNTIANKGWKVYVNGQSNSNIWTPTASTTLDETGQETVTPIPFWAKPINSDEQHAQYVDSDGNFYNILGAQFIYGDNLETYGMFTCEEDAATQMRLTKIGEEEIETA